MAVSRAAIAAYLTDAYSPLLVDFGLAAEDSPGALTAPINRALMRLGVAHADLTTAEVAEEEAAFVLASYYLLQKMQGSTAARNVNISMGDPNTSASDRDRASNLKDAMEAVKADMKDLGIGTASGWYAASIGLDYLEPDDCEVA